MARMIVTGDALVIKSNITFADMEKLTKLRPSAMVLCEQEEDGTRAEVFRVKVGGSEMFNQYGITFTSAARDGTGCAITTVRLPEGVTDPKEYLVENFSTALMRLNCLEDQMLNSLAEVADAQNAVREFITIAE